MKTDLALVDKADLSKVEDNSLNGQQLEILLRKTPNQYIKQRPAKGGGTWDYVTGGYVKKSLNLLFGWDWDFEIVDERIEIAAKEVVVKGRLTCRTNGRTIVKMQYGNKDIIFRRGTETPLSIGNDLKAAATDALKKCAAEIGIAADIYNKEDFREVQVVSDNNIKEAIETKFKAVRDRLNQADIEAIEQVLIEENENEYKRILKTLNKIK